MWFFKHFKRINTAAKFVTIVSVGACVHAVADDAENGDIDLKTVQKSGFNQIVDAVFSDPYEELPNYKVTKKLFGKSGDSPKNHVFKAATRSLTSTADLYDFPKGQKIFQPNGICFAGQWVVDQSSPYTGLFKPGANVPVIARASVALDGTLRKHKRAFGMAVKLFPHDNPNQAVNTVNLFVMNSLGGVKTENILDLSMDNAPALGALPPFNKWSTMLRLQKDFAKADRELSGKKSEIAYRPVRQLAMVDSRTGESMENGKYPTWVKLTIDDNTPRINEDDFRNELRIKHYPNERLVWKIDIAEGDLSEKKQAQWLRLGELRLTRSVTSKTCDQRLHFKHPIGN